ncbi:MAG: sigma-54-dependent transcriptional regulator [Thermodesulfobacteriota bacterium]
MSDSVLIIDDEPDMLKLLQRSLSSELNADIKTVSDIDNALKLIRSKDFDLILTDIRMPGMNGLDLLEIIKEEKPGQTVVMMTAYGDIDTVIDAMKKGAYDFITKPFDHDALVVRLNKAMERALLLKENQRLLKSRSKDEALSGIVGSSPSMKKIFETLHMVAPSDVTVLLTGESGTGKNMAAKAIHSLSERKKENFVTVNCPTIPENILESELFGYKKGAFTHAQKNKKGLFQEADKGTIFLDEIGEISPSIQTKLLMVLQDKQIKPLGDTESVNVDTRIIASTNQNLFDLVQKGLFREDLYYRLNVVSIEMPPLRQRQKDIPAIAGHLLEKHCNKMNKEIKRISPELMDILSSEKWVGNIRELENIIIRGILYSSDDVINPADAGYKKDNALFSGVELLDYENLSYKEAKEKNLYEFNMKVIGKSLEKTSGNVSKTARNLGLERQALQKIMKRYDIDADEYRKN